MGFNSGFKWLISYVQTLTSAQHPVTFLEGTRGKVGGLDLHLL